MSGCPGQGGATDSYCRGAGFSCGGGRGGGGEGNSARSFKDAVRKVSLILSLSLSLGLIMIMSHFVTSVKSSKRNTQQLSRVLSLFVTSVELSKGKTAATAASMYAVCLVFSFLSRTRDSAWLHASAAIVNPCGRETEGAPTGTAQAVLL